MFEGRATRKTLVLASIDGSTLGEVGAIRLAEELGAPSQVDAVLVVSDLGSPTRRGPFLQAWSNDSRRAGIAPPAHRGRLDPPGAGPLGRRRAAPSASSRGSPSPSGVGAQGPLLERGFDAVRISGSGELPPTGNGPVDVVDEDRLGTLGRATLRTVTAVDQGAHRRSAARRPTCWP